MADATLGLPRYLAGLDIGQQSDPSALAVIERRWQLANGRYEPLLDARHLERIPLRTPYPLMVKGVKERLAHLHEPCELVVDATGVGRAIVDLLRESYTVYDEEHHQRIPLPGRPTILAVTLTAGEHAHQDPEHWDEWYVPKRDVIMALVVALQQRRFRAAQGLSEAETLIKEAQQFQWKVSKAGQDQYGAWREGQHDDLLLAVAIPAWWAEQHKPLARSRAPVMRREPVTGPQAWMG